MDRGTIGKEIQIHRHKQCQLYAEAEEVGHHCGDGDDQTGKVDLAKHGLIGSESSGGLVQTVGEVEPADIACHIEQGLGDAVGAHLGDATEHHHVHNDGQDGLDDVPQGTEDGLLVLYDDVALDEQCYQVAIAPDLFKVHMPQLVVGGDD